MSYGKQAYLQRRISSEASNWKTAFCQRMENAGESRAGKQR